MIEISKIVHASCYVYIFLQDHKTEKKMAKGEIIIRHFRQKKKDILSVLVLVLVMIMISRWQFEVFQCKRKIFEIFCLCSFNHCMFYRYIQSFYFELARICWNLANRNKLKCVPDVADSCIYYIFLKQNISQLTSNAKIQFFSGTSELLKNKHFCVLYMIKCSLIIGSA